MKRNGMRRQARAASAVVTAEGPGTAGHGDARVDRGADQPVARIADERRARIGHERDIVAGPEPAEELRPCAPPRCGRGS